MFIILLNTKVKHLFGSLDSALRPGPKSSPISKVSMHWMSLQLACNYISILASFSRKLSQSTKSKHLHFLFWKDNSILGQFKARLFYTQIMSKLLSLCSQLIYFFTKTYLINEDFTIKYATCFIKRLIDFYNAKL